MLTSAIMPLLVTIFSILSGLAVFYLVSNLAKEQKKKQVADAFSHIINFVLFVWLSKILLNLSLFFSDPLAMLAYPSNSKAFYLAIFFSAAMLFYNTKRDGILNWQIIQTLVYAILPALFFYEFVELALFEDRYALGNLILYAVLLMVFLMLNERVSSGTVGSVLLSVWTAGVLLISAIQSSSSAFGYALDPWFIILLFMVGHVLLLLSIRRRRTTYERN